MAEATLNDRLGLDCMPIEITEDGRIVSVVDYAPDVYFEDVHPDGLGSYVNPEGWEFLNGYSGQDRYAGPVMHASEFIGGRMEADIMESPGVYAAVVVDCLEPMNDEDPDDIEPAGWAVLRKV